MADEAELLKKDIIIMSEEVGDVQEEFTEIQKVVAGLVN
jgi:hypothetical protein